LLKTTSHYFEMDVHTQTHANTHTHTHTHTKRCIIVYSLYTDIYELYISGKYNFCAWLYFPLLWKQFVDVHNHRSGRIAYFDTLKKHQVDIIRE